MKLVARLSITALVITASGCEAGAYMQYYFTPAGWRAQKAVKQLEKAVGHRADAGTTGDTAPSLADTRSVGYVQDAALRDGLTGATAAIAQGETTASNVERLIFDLLVREAIAAKGEPAAWPTERLNKFFGRVAGLENFWAGKPTLTVRKNGPTRVITATKADGQSLSAVYADDSDSLCRAADKVLISQDKVGMEMFTQSGEKKTVPHPFAGKPCSKAALKDYTYFTAALEGATSPTPELGVLWKKTGTESSVWLLRFRDGKTPEGDSLVGRAEKFL